MTDLVIVTYDWAPDLPRGFVRDVRIRWALEEAVSPIASRARRSKIAARRIRRTGLSDKPRGWPMVTFGSSKSARSFFISERKAKR